MPNPGHAPGDLEAAWEALQRHGGQQTLGAMTNAAAELGLPPTTLRSRIEKYRKLHDMPEGQKAAIAAAGLSVETAKAGWRVVVHEDGSRDSVYWRSEAGSEQSFADAVRQAIADGYADGPLPYEPRPVEPSGDYLLVIDLADVHFGKLCVKTETGYTYNREVARHRVIEGTKALLRGLSGFGIGRILFILGNDILHVDNGGTTTGGTPQDTDGSMFQMWSDAKAAITDAIKLCAEVADVDLVHCMSNHDWRMGWTLSQAIAAGFESWPTVNATPYNMSEAHRKYYGYENNAFIITHGDGTKEEKLYGHFVQEARQLLASCTHTYALLHHLHHKIRKRRGVDVFQSEKDHNGLTAIVTGSHNVEGGHLNIEYVRSPSPPDGWHDRNGFINRQAVEAFIYHPRDGQKLRMTEWF